MSSTNLTDFRNQYLTKVKGRLTAADITDASDTDLIMQLALLKAYDAVNRFDPITPEAVAPLETMTGAELDAYLLDASNRQSFELVLSSPEAMKALATSIGAMGAIATSSKAMTALAASSTAMTAVAASSTAMTAVAASSTAMTAVLASSTAWATVVASSTAMTAVAASSTAMTAVAASSTAMTAVLDSQVARGAVWGSSTALSAIQSAPSAVLNALQSHAQVGMMNNNPSNLQGTFISGKSMTLRCRNTGGSDTNYLRDLAGGSGSGNDSFSTSTAWQTRVRAYKDIRHYSYGSNYTFQAYVVNMN